MNGRIAIAYSAETPIGKVFISPGGLAMATNRIGQCKDGKLISTAELSDDEIAAAGLTGMVLPASEEANRLHSYKKHL